MFIILVFFHHIIPYIQDAGASFSQFECKMLSFLSMGQNVVVMFLVYSGYGVTESLKSKSQYIDSFPKRRILTTLLNFDIAVLVFALCRALLGQTITPAGFLLSLIGWDSMGNSNWYIFAILFLYGIFYIAHRFISELYRDCFFLSAVIVMIYVLSLVKAPYWYDTLLCFWGGHIVSRFKCRIEKLTSSYYFPLLAGCLMLYFLTKYTRLAAIHFAAAGWIPKVLAFTPLLINLQHLFWGFVFLLITMKISIDSRFLNWCGRRLFPIYIYQRLPMMLMSAAFIKLHQVSYVIICFGITMVIAFFYRYWEFRGFDQSDVTRSK